MLRRPIGFVVDQLELLRAVVDAGASDLHCKPGSPPVLRIGGELVRQDGSALTAEGVARLAGEMLTIEQQQELIDNGSVVGAHSASGIGRFRFSAFRQRGSVAMVLHVVPDEIRSLDDLGLPTAARTLAGADKGLVLVASPVGNGATTTLNALVEEANATRPAHIVCVEDPIEVLHRDRTGVVSQLEVGSDVRSIADGVRAASKLDVDIVAVSDIGSRDTALAVIDACARGRLVLAGIGGHSVLAAVHTFLELFTVSERDIMRDAFARSVAGVLAQRLLPTTDGGQVAAVESMVRTTKLVHALSEGGRDAEVLELMAEGDYHGMQTMDQALVRLVRAERIEADVALQLAHDPEELRIELLR